MKAFLIAVLLPFFMTTGQVPSNKEAQAEMSRQCCSVLVAYGGIIVEYTACSGWLFSNDAKSYAKACEEAREAAGIL